MSHSKAEIHSLLARQLRRHLGKPDDLPEAWRPFLEAVNEAYWQSDDDREMLERSLELSSQELIETNADMRALIHELEAKNEEMERLTYTISHDLKGPVFTIQGFLGVLRNDAREGDAGRLEKDVHQISVAAAQIGRLLNELLEFTRVGRVVETTAEVDLGEIAREAADLVAGRTLELGAEVDVASDLPTVTGDRARLLQVFQNLVENALKFMGDQSTPRVEIFSRRCGDDDVICVRDNGIGIQEEDQDKIFGLFDRLQVDDDGTGIGLALVKRIVEAHGGTVWVESEGTGHGSTFCLTVPGSK